MAVFSIYHVVYIHFILDMVANTTLSYIHK